MSQIALDFREELQPKQTSKIPFGIHTNCQVVSLEVKPGEYVDINFADSEGHQHNKRLWYPNGKYPQEVKVKHADGTEIVSQETVDQAKRREAKERINHVTVVGDILLGKEAVNTIVAKVFKSLDYALYYDTYMTEMAKALAPKCGKVPVNLKLIYDSEGKYSTFGNFPDYIEAYVEGKPATLSFTSWEKSNRCTYKHNDTKVDEISNINLGAIDELLS